jgi:uncharacterized protein (DUF736 family)
VTSGRAHVTTRLASRAPPGRPRRSFTGTVKTLALNVKAKIAPAEKENDKAADYRILAGAMAFGAAWRKT